jgi:hypothetical protein
LPFAGILIALQFWVIGDNNHLKLHARSGVMIFNVAILLFLPLAFHRLRVSSGVVVWEKPTMGHS